MPACSNPFRFPKSRSSIFFWALAPGLVSLLIIPLPAAGDLDAVFALDTTGSMGGELREVQDRLHNLADSLSKSREGERIRIGIVAFRDRGDDYVTRASTLTEDLDTSYAFLASLTAGGGGDGPESVIAALEVALFEMPWDLSDGTDRQVFLVGDAPPHLDYGDEPTSEDLIAAAQEARIVVNTIGCRSLPESGISFFRRFAYATEGSYQHIGRVLSPRPGALTEAMNRAAGPARNGLPEGGAEISLVRLGHRDATSSGILIRRGEPGTQDPEGQEEQEAPRILEVFLPEGLALAGNPRASFGNRGLEVELELMAGSGGLDLYALETCPPLTSPVHAVLGGR